MCATRVLSTARRVLRVTTAAAAGARTLREVYERAEGEGTATRFTVPVLFDTATNRIVSNESSEIIRMFNAEFNALAKHPGAWVAAAMTGSCKRPCAHGLRMRRAAAVAVALATPVPNVFCCAMQRLTCIPPRCAARSTL